MGEGYAVGETGDDFAVEAHVVVDVCQIGLTRLDFVDNFQCFIDSEVCKMVFVTQCVDYQCVDAFEFEQFIIVDAFSVGDVGEVADAIAQDWQTTMVDYDWSDFHAVNLEVVVGVDDVESIGRHSGVEAFSEAVFKALTEFVGYVLFCVDRHFASLAVWAEVFDAADVVVVNVGEQNGVDVGDVVAQCLLTEIGRRID